MFDWHSLFSCSLTGNLLEPGHQEVHFVIFSDPRNYESRWCGVEDCVASAHSRLNCQVVCLERGDQARLRGYPSSVLKMV